MGFTQRDFEELQRLQGKRGEIRFAPRATRPPPIQLSFLPALEKPRGLAAKERRRKPPDEPGYERFQLRLW